MSAPNTFIIKSDAPSELVPILLTRPAVGLTKDPRGLAEVELARFCQICYHFDPSKAPSDSGSHPSSWAQTEYKISDGSPVAKIQVEQAKQVFEAAMNGCPYCAMIVGALNVSHPGWQTEDAFMHIFLAAKLPVFVRLGFGGVKKIPISREEAARIGVDVPEGQTMSYNVTFVAHGKEAIDVEIYRPRTPDTQPTIGDIVFGELVKHMGYSNDIANDAGSQRCVDFIKEKIDTCVKHHDCVQDGGALPLLPDRVIWINANNESRIQLVEPNDIRAKYVALSYCWGPVSPDMFLTNANTLQMRKSGIEFNDLPPLFQDVVKTARALQVDYIWIDRLCIVQGDDKDFQTQVTKMGEVYGNATLTIAAASATSENDRILVSREKKWLSHDHKLDFNGHGCIKTRSRRLWHPLGKEEKGGDYGKISTRAWIWQERLLAARTIFFTPGGLKFECRRHSVWEGFDGSRIGHSWSTKLDSATNDSWTELVEEFTGRDITRPSDRLPAIDAVAKRIQKSTKWSPCWGLWEKNLVQCLSWQPKRAPRGGGPDCHPNPGHYAPTWSWASVDGPISYVNARRLNGLDDTDPMQWKLEASIYNAASGIIQFVGQAMRIQLQVTVKPSEVPKADPNEPKKFRYDYTLGGGPNDKQGIPFQPDVPLKPWTGDLFGSHVSTIVRVPYGESPPKESWNAICICMLVGTRKLTNLALLFGQSLQKKNAFERIGIVYGLSPAGFSMSKRGVIHVV